MEIIQLSPQQRRMWRAHQATGKFTDRAFVAVTVRGRLDLEMLQNACQAVMRRHEILRTTFRETPGIAVPVQAIGETPYSDFYVCDITSIVDGDNPNANEEIAVDLTIRRHRNSKEAGPVIAVLRCASETTLLVVSVPILCVDERGITNVVSQIASEYDAIVNGRVYHQETAEYADISAVFTHLLKSDETPAGRDYWAAFYKQNSVAIEVPFSLQGQKTGRSKTFVTCCSDPGGEDRKAFFLALTAVLLSRITGSNNLTIFVMYPFRDQPMLGLTPGPLGAYLPIGVVVKSNSVFEEVYASTKATLREASQWEESYDDNPSPDPVAPGHLVIQFDYSEEPTLYVGGDATFDITRLFVWTGAFDLRVKCIPRDGHIEVHFEYDEASLHAEDICRISEEWMTLLRNVQLNPNVPVGSLSYIGPLELGRLRGFADQGGEVDGVKDVIALIESHGKAAPHDCAIIHKERHFTYHDLITQANRVTSRLVELGVEKGQRIGIYLERSPELFAGILGIIRAGGAYVPLDPDYPPNRLGWMVENSDISFVLAGGEKALSWIPLGVKILPIHSDTGIEEGDCAVQTPAADMAGLAYVIYTSGSTGVPKGVMVSKANLASSIAARRAFYLRDPRRYLLLSSVSFDSSVAGIFWTLSTGGTLVLPKDGEYRSPQALARLIGEEKITHLLCLPSLYSAILEAASIHELDSLDVVIVAGESCPSKLLNAHAMKLGRVALCNEYGPTEGTVWCAADYDCATLHSKTSSSIGRPIPNARAYVLDSNGSLVGIGVPGELYIAGPGITWGYLGEARQTADRFVPDPYSDHLGGRLYRTGDLVSWTGAGTLNFLGRCDDQVKIRGYRIELGEIQNTLLAHPGVVQCVVVARDYAEGDRRLVGYVVPTPGHAHNHAAELRLFLRDRLPDYMVPSFIELLERLPLNANGKVDRTALPAPMGQSREPKGRRLPSPVEELLICIWQQLLKIDRIGTDDNFFELGGHSLLATQLVSRIRSTLDVEVPLRTIFEAPTLAAIAAAVDHLRNDLGFLAPAPPISRVERKNDMSPSFAQRRLWFLQRLEEGSATYNCPVAVRLHGELDDRAFEISVQKIVERHEVLRTRIVEVGGEPVQRIEEVFRGAVAWVDLRGSICPEIIAERIGSREAHHAFNLSSDPLLRVHVLRLGDRDNVLLFTLHHIVSDGWSVGIFLREFKMLYDAYRRGDPVALGDLPIQYADFAQWQNDWMKGEVLERHLAYWKRQLEGIEPLQLSTDYPRPALMTYSGARASVKISKELTSLLRAMASRAGATLYMVLLSAWGLLLCRCNNKKDLVIGSPIANRNRLEIEQLIGCFINTLALRIDIHGIPTFLDLVKRVRQTVLDAHAHQDLPFERLVEELSPIRNLSGEPIVQTMFILQNAPSAPIALEGMEVVSCTSEVSRAKFELLLSIEEQGGCLQGDLEYATELFDKSSVERLLEQWVILLQQVAENSELFVSNLSIVSPTDIDLLNGWNNIETPLSVGDECLHDFVTAQAHATPSKVALVTGHRQLSYRELDDLSRKFAIRLRTLGIILEQRIAICVTRNIEMVIVLLGVLRAGGVYVPLDRNQPKSRVDRILKDVAPAFIITDRETRALFDDCGLPQIVVMPDSFTDLEDGDLLPKSHPSNLAYILYTSGSTGAPKGVCISHRSAVSFLKWALTSYSREQLTRVLAGTSLAFDLSIFELFAPLCAGGAVILVDNVLASADVPSDFQPTLINTVPSAIRELVNMDAVPHCVSVVNLAGEALPRDLVQNVYARTGVKDLYNLYGPTEATTYATFVRLSANDTVSIGRPISNTRVYVLDTDGEQMPIGCIGELYIGGLGVARGYLDDPMRTAEKFVPDAFSGQPGERLYRTGDLARWRRDGQLDFLGRLDEQVKVRGFRIELGEVESALAAHPHVDQCAVVTRDSLKGHKRLIAYIVLSSDGADRPSLSDLRRHLQARIPDYMIPAAIEVLEAMPLNSNGKLDRKALPPPKTEIVPASIEVHRPVLDLLAGIWEELLEIDRVGANDNFFELGGHSLLATQLVSRVRSALSVELSLRRVFEAKTLATLADHVGDLIQEQNHLMVSPILRVERRQYLPTSFAQQRLWFLQQLEPESCAYNCPAAVRLRGRLHPLALEKCFSAIIARHEVLRTRFVDVDGEPAQEIVRDDPGKIVHWVDLQGVDDAEWFAMTLADKDAQRVFDLAKSPLIRVCCLRMGPDHHMLVVTLHHIVCDGWSVGILLRDFTSLYESYVTHNPLQQQDLAIQYADYASWQRMRLDDGSLAKQLAYWRKQLDGVEPLQILPDHPRSTLVTNRARVVSSRFSKEMTDRIRKFAHEQGVTLYMLLIAAWSVVLRQQTGGQEVVVGSPIANRVRLELEPLIGCFINTIALRISFKDEPNFPSLLARVRNTVLEAYVHQEIPFEFIAEEIGTSRAASLTAITFVMQPPITADIRCDGLHVELVSVPNDLAKRDLTIHAHEEADSIVHVATYNFDLFSNQRIQGLLQQVETILLAALPPHEHGPQAMMQAPEPAVFLF
jgi:amino acid adenylation domain-containing protein